jgi:hypothetical protein
LRLREARAQDRPPLCVKAGVKRARIECPEGISAYPELIVEDQAQLGLEGQVGTHKDTPERIRIFTVDAVTVSPVIARLQAHVIRAGFVSGLRRSDCEI